MSIQIDRLDGLSSSTAVKGPARCATTANITLSDLQTIDGVALADGDRVLVRAQTDGRDNGIYVASVGTWRRSKDFSGNRDVRRGTKVTVTDGTTYATSEWICTATNPVVFDTSEIAFAQIFFSTGAPVTITGLGVIVKERLTDLQSVTPDDENYGGRVLDDPDPVNNGDYFRQAAAWVKGADLQRYNISKLTITGGTVNAIEADADDGVNPASAVGFFIDIPPGDENTDPVTIAINGGTPIPALNYDGSAFAAGEFRGRMLLSNEGASLQSLDAAAQSASDAAAEHAAAEADADRAEAARDVALGAIPNEFTPTRTSLKAIDTSTITHVYLTEVGREGQFVFKTGDYSDLVTADTEEGVYIKADDIAATSGAWVRFYGDEALVTWFGALNDGAGSGNVAANNTALAGARAWLLAEIASADAAPQLAFPPGVYDYDDFPNFAIQNTAVVGKGEVRLRYHGTETAVIYDGSDHPLGGVSNVTFGPFHIDCPGTAKDGARVSWIRRNSRVILNVHGAGPTYAGLRATSCVCATFLNYTCSVNDGGWYLGAAPGYGLVLDRTSGEPSSTMSFSSFYDPVIEGMPIGIELLGALGNSFFGGTSEGCSDAGVRVGPDAALNKFFNVDFEANGFADVFYIGGRGNAFVECHAMTGHAFESGTRNRVIGGSVQNVSFGPSATDNLVQSLDYNQYGGGGIGGAGVSNNRVENVYDVTNDSWSNGPKSNTALTVTGSPFAYTNSDVNDVWVRVQGGVVSYIDITRSGAATNVGTTSGFFQLRPGDTVSVGYSTVPNMSVVRG